MKKVLIFSTAYLPFIGGAELAVKEITERLGGDFIFDMVTARLKMEAPSRERVGNVNIYRIGIGVPKIDKYWLALFGHKFAQKLHRKNQYDAIWAIMASYGGLSALFFKKKNPEIPFLLTLQEGDDLKYIEKRMGILRHWFRQIFQRANYVQCISNFLAAWAKKMGAKCPVEVMPNGVNLNKFPISNFQFPNKKLKEKLGIKENEKVVITVSRLVGKNGIGDLINAVQKLRIINYKLLILGSGPLEKNLKLQVTSYKLQDKVLFLGEMPNEHVPEYLAIADVFARPSLSEGLGTAFLEAMAAAVPIIGTKVGGIPDFLQDGETGLFCEVQNPQSIAEKINLLLTDENLRQKLIFNGKKLIEEKYQWDLIADKMRNIFYRLCAF